VEEIIKQLIKRLKYFYNTLKIAIVQEESAKQEIENRIAQDGGHSNLSGAYASPQSRENRLQLFKSEGFLLRANTARSNIKEAFQRIMRLSESLSSVPAEQLASLDTEHNPFIDLLNLLNSNTISDQSQIDPIINFFGGSQFTLHQAISQAFTFILPPENHDNVLHAMQEAIKATRSSWTLSRKDEKCETLVACRQSYNLKQSNDNLLQFLIEAAKNRSTSFFAQGPTASLVAFYNALSIDSRCIIHAKLAGLPVAKIDDLTVNLIGLDHFQSQIFDLINRKTHEAPDLTECTGEVHHFLFAT